MRREQGSSMRESILVFSKYYEPGTRAGGQLKTVVNLVKALHVAYDFRIVTSDRDIGDEAAYQGIQTGTWTRREGADVYYLPSRGRVLKQMKEILGMREYSLLYLNSYFSPLFALLPMILRRLSRDPRPVLVAPRGEFSPGALEHKRFKKLAYRSLVRAFGIFDGEGVCWQASSSLEAKEIADFLPSTVKRIAVSMDFPDDASDSACRLEAGSASGEPLRIIFVSRICPKKNLDFALTVLASLKIDAVLDIYGPDEDQEYWRKCLRLIETLPSNVKAVFHGHIDPGDVPTAMSASDLFFFPTKGENFGYVIWEALSAGTPALLSDQTPWPRDAGFGCAAFPLSRPDLFADHIARYAALDSRGKSSARREARRVAQSFVDPESIRSAAISMIETTMCGATVAATR
jgi:glycosyltransferase involved in cell wall biosynthesis